MSSMLSCVLVLLSILISPCSLNEATRNLVDERIENHDATLSRNRFSNYIANAKSDRFVLNTNFWAKGIDFSCVSPWNSTHGRMRAGTAISKRHIVYAHHFPIAKGSRIVFTDGLIGTCPVRLVDSRHVSNTDIMIGLLDVELTPNIRPAKILPEDYGKWLTYGSRWPFVTFNQNEEVYLSELACTLNSTDKSIALYNRMPDSSEWRRFGGTVVVGDSGNPCFLLIKDQPVLIYCLLSGGIGHGPMIHLHRHEIQRLMDELCPGYKLETFDFDALDEPDGVL